MVSRERIRETLLDTVAEHSCNEHNRRCHGEARARVELPLGCTNLTGRADRRISYLRDSRCGRIWSVGAGRWPIRLAALCFHRHVCLHADGSTVCPARDRNAMDADSSALSVRGGRSTGEFGLQPASVGVVRHGTAVDCNGLLYAARCAVGIRYSAVAPTPRNFNLWLG